MFLLIISEKCRCLALTNSVKITKAYFVEVMVNLKFSFSPLRLCCPAFCFKAFTIIVFLHGVFFLMVVFVLIGATASMTFEIFQLNVSRS